MIVGMTGFGGFEKNYKKIKYLVEIKSQNHRYLDIVFFLPAGFSSLEKKIRDIISKEIQRGRVTVSVKIIDKEIHHLVYNREIIKDYLHYAKEIKDEFHLVNNLGVADIFRLPGVFETRETGVDAENIWLMVQSGIQFSLKSLLAMRRREGKSLAANLRNILKRMSLQIKKIEIRSRFILQDKKKTASPEEFLSFQKSCDVNEEISRLKHYIEEFNLYLNSTTAVGKKLDFVAQEMQRETNTIGSKVQDRIVSNAVIALKSKIEKLREQAQNVE